MKKPKTYRRWVIVYANGFGLVDHTFVTLRLARAWLSVRTTTEHRKKIRIVRYELKPVESTP